MKTNSLSRRLEDLEMQQEETPKIHLRWYDDPEPLGPNVIRIKLRWLDDCRGGLQ